MGSGNLYSRPANTKKNVKGNRYLRALLVAGILLISMPFITKAQPVFDSGGSQNIPVCYGTPSVILDGYLTITDLTNGLPETWTVIPPYPTGGTVAALSYVGTSDGGVLPITGGSGGAIVYYPNTGFIGNDVVYVQVSNGLDSTVTMLNIFVTPLPSLTPAPIAAVCAGTTTAVLNYSDLQYVGPTSSIFPFSGGTQAFTVPPGVDTVYFDLQGGAGGNDSHSGITDQGNGGRVQGAMSVYPGQQLNITVGGQGSNGSPSGAAGGFNGGGNANYYFFGTGGAGGGGTEIVDAASTTVLAVAGGGGGGGWDTPGPSFGGAGGGTIGGASGNNVSGSHAGGGTQLTGGAGATYYPPTWTSGSNGSYLTGGDGSVQGISGGGGGGYYGGGGGIWTGGGGGSSYTNPAFVNASSITHTQGYNIGDGIAYLSYNIPGTYTISYANSPGAIGQGFVGVTAAPLPASPINIAVPATAAPGVYDSIYLYISNGTCTSVVYVLAITINPIPSVNTTPSTAWCNGDSTSDVIFTGPVPGTVFNWTNDNTAIGLSAGSTGNIAAFVATDSSITPITGDITVTPLTNSGGVTCMGADSTFTITVNPTPTFTTPDSMFAICDSMLPYYSPDGTPTGRSFTWFRGLTTGITNDSASGSDNPFYYPASEVLNNTTSAPVTVTYNYAIAANGCLAFQNVTVVVNPKPQLISVVTSPVCSGSPFGFTASSATTPSETYMWNRNPVMGISDSATTGTGNISETLHDTTANPVVVDYTYTLGLAGTTCTSTEDIFVTVNPMPMLNSGATTTPPAPCSNTPLTYTPGSLTTGVTYSWLRLATPGITNPTNSGFGITSLTETLISNSPNPVADSYQISMVTTNGCTNTQYVYVTVNPTPKISTVTTAIPTSLCSGSSLNYTATSLTPATTITWTRDSVTGITASDTHTFGGATISDDTLINQTSHFIIDSYTYVLSANGCSNTEYVPVTVWPLPVLSSPLTATQICDSNKFNYTPLSGTAGTVFNWYRPYIPGIYALQETGTGNPDQDLINSTYVPVDVTYIYTLVANGCSNTQDVNVIVNPTPKLNPPYTASVCSGTPFNYTPTSYTPGAVFAWDRPAVSNIAPSSNFASAGPGVIDETLINGTLSPIVVVYVYRLGINGCTNLITQDLVVTVNPAPAMPTITTMPPTNLCEGTMYQNFVASGLASSVNYHWSATNASVWAVGAISGNTQGALVSFPNPGTAVVTISADVDGLSCTSASTFTANVSGSANEYPEVIYYNGQFICLKNDNDTYQWGYDNASTLDSSMIAGAINQNYDNSSPNFSLYRYWVITTKDGCMQKSYYNLPTGVANVNSDMTDMRVYPNPASEDVNVEINTTIGGNMQLEVLNMLGQKIAIQNVVNQKAVINVASLPAGAYLIDCYREGVKIATARFIKN